MAEIKGQILEIGDFISGKGTNKYRNLILKTEEKYPQVLCIEFWNDKINQILNLDEKDTVTISYNIRGSRWQKDNIVKYYTKLVGWKVSESNEVSNAEYLPDRETNEDDLPF